MKFLLLAIHYNYLHGKHLINAFVADIFSAYYTVDYCKFIDFSSEKDLRNCQEHI